jgi:hypothetical protein
MIIRKLPRYWKFLNPLQRHSTKGEEKIEGNIKGGDIL